MSVRLLQELGDGILQEDGTDLLHDVSTDVTVALSGVAATVAAGLLGVAMAAAATGTQATTAAGSIGPVTNLTGVAATTSAGSVSVGVAASGLGSLTNDLVDWWNLAEASGSATGAHAGIVLAENGGTIGTGTCGGRAARDFERSSNQYLETADSAALSFSADQAFTIALRMQLESLNAFNGILGKAAGVPVDEFSVFFINGVGIRLSVWDSSNVAHELDDTSLPTPTLGQCYTIICWHDPVANTLNISIDDDATPTSVSYTLGTQPAGTSSFQIGAVGAGSNHDGLIGSVAYWKRVLTSDERTAYYNGGAGVAYADISSGGIGVSATASTSDLTSSRTIALTGVSATAAPGTITADTGGGAPNTYALTGIVATTGVGSVSPEPSIPLSGQDCTASPGSVTHSITIALSGVSSTATPGSVTPSQILAVTGLSSTATVGSVTQSAAVVLAGQASTATPGSVTSSGGTPEGEINLALTGLAATAAAGSVTTDRTLVLAGHQATGSAGSVALGDRAMVLSGDAAAAAVGDVVPGLARALTGSSSTADVGSLTRSMSVPLAGLDAATGVGSLVSSGGDTGPLATADWIVKMPADDSVVQLPADDHVVRMPV